MQQIHCVNDQSTVTRILSHGITKLLDRLYRVVGQDSAPAVKIGRGKVPIDALDGRDTQLRNLGKNITNYSRRRIISIDQNGETESVVWHVLLLLLGFRLPGLASRWRRIIYAPGSRIKCGARA